MWSVVLVGIIVISNASAKPWKPQGRIIGGQDTSIEKLPYQVSLQFKLTNSYGHWCGASIISKIYLLSAAHCNPKSSLPLLYARFGSSTFATGGELLKVQAMTPHPDFVKSILDYDFSIVSFAPGVEIPLGPGIQIIQLAKVNDRELQDGDLLTVSGWGVIIESSVVSPLILKKVELPVYEHEDCKASYSSLTSRQICLGGTKEGGTGACFGDSGGPAVYKGILYGVISGGWKCSGANIPELFSKISVVENWLAPFIDLNDTFSTQ